MSGTDEANPVTAVLTKLALMYGTPAGDEESFISFPLTAIPMTSQDLNFLKEQSDLQEAKRRRFAANFATLVNRIPSPDIVWQSDGTLLWEEYGSVFSGMAEWAWNNRSSEEEDRLQEARETAERLRETYEEHRTVYRDVKKALSQAKLTADHADDEAVKQRAREKIGQLENEKEDAYRAWIDDGHKHEYEDAVETIDRLQQSGPSSLRDRWEERFSKAQRTELYSNARVYQTEYWPRDFAENDDRPWTTVTLDHSEVSSLSETAMEELPDLTDSGLVSSVLQPDLKIKDLSVDITTIEIRRPWFDATLLESGVWRWRYDREPFSNGANPPTGRLPAYVTELVFARDLTIEVESDETTYQTVRELQDGALRKFGPIPLEQPVSTVSAENLGQLGAASFDPAESTALQTLNREHTAAGIESEAVSNSGSSSGEAVVSADFDEEILVAEPRTRRLTSIITESNSSSEDESVETDSVSSNIEITGSGQPFSAIETGLFRPEWPFDPSELENISENEQPGECSGEVTESITHGLDNPIQEAKLTFTAADGDIEKTVKTDAEGQYTVELPPGEYRATVRRYGYEKQESGPRAIVSDPGSRTTRNFSLEPDPSETGSLEMWDSLLLIGFVCQKVPESPNPDPSLAWESD